MGRIQNRDFEIEADKLGLFPSPPLSQLGPWSTRPWVNSARAQVYTACCSIIKDDVVHVLICQNVYVHVINTVKEVIGHLYNYFFFDI